MVGQKVLCDVDGIISWDFVVLLKVHQCSLNLLVHERISKSKYNVHLGIVFIYIVNLNHVVSL